MKTQKIFLTVLMISTASLSFSQKITIEGDLKILKGQSAIKIDFSYDNLVIGAGIMEVDYIAGKVKAWNEKEAGKGEAWREMWFANRKKIFEPAFRKKFFEYTGLSSDEAAPYTLLFKTIYTEPGWSGGVIGGLGSISGEAWIIDSSDPSHPIAKILVDGSKGKDYNGGDFESGRRLRRAYVLAAEYIGWYINKARRKNKI